MAFVSPSCAPQNAIKYNTFEMWLKFYIHFRERERQKIIVNIKIN